MELVDLVGLRTAHVGKPGVSGLSVEQRKARRGGVQCRWVLAVLARSIGLLSYLAGRGYQVLGVLLRTHKAYGAQTCDYLPSSSLPLIAALDHCC